MALEGKSIAEEAQQETHTHTHDHVGAHALGDIDIKYGYCTEFIVKLFNPEKFDEKFMKIHYHKWVIL